MSAPIVLMLGEIPGAAQQFLVGAAFVLLIISFCGLLYVSVEGTPNAKRQRDRTAGQICLAGLVGGIWFFLATAFGIMITR